jgi:dGTPase
MEEEVLNASERLRVFMFERVYCTKFAMGEEGKAELMLSEMYNYFTKNPQLLPPSYVKLLDKYPVYRVVCDYLSSMTDRYAVYIFNSIFIPKGWTFIDENN